MKQLGNGPSDLSIFSISNFSDSTITRVHCIVHDSCVLPHQYCFGKTFHEANPQDVKGTPALTPGHLLWSLPGVGCSCWNLWLPTTLTQGTTPNIFDHAFSTLQICFSVHFFPDFFLLFCKYFHLRSN